MVFLFFELLISIKFAETSSITKVGINSKLRLPLTLILVQNNFIPLPLQGYQQSKLLLKLISLANIASKLLNPGPSFHRG